MTKSRGGRINARLEPELRAKVDFLRRRTKLGATEIIKLSIEQYYESVRRGPRAGKEVLSARGFIGCGEAEPTLSTTYKSVLATSLAKKA